jgi:rod shape determining protein RodA
MYKLDWWLFLPASFLSLLGLAVVLGAAPKELGQQAIFLGVGVGLFFLIGRLDRSLLTQLAPVWYLLSLLLLAVTFVFGAVTRGSTRWLDLGVFRFQPSELTKPFWALSFGWLASKYDRLAGKEFALLLFSFLPPFLLIFRQPDLGSALVLGSLWLGILVAGKVKLKLFLPFLIGILAGLPFFWHLLQPYQQVRITTFLNPQADPLGASYNQVQATIAVGSGGFLGRGLGQGSQAQLEFLPEHQTDFIFATLAEEFGFVGSLGLLVLYTALLLHLLHLARQTEDATSRLSIIGIFTYLWFQATAHIGINVGVLPVTGITLPFVSVGGSSLIASWVSLGVAQALTGSHKPRPVLNLG